MPLRRARDGRRERVETRRRRLGGGQHQRFGVQGGDFERAGGERDARGARQAGGEIARVAGRKRVVDDGSSSRSIEPGSRSRVSAIKLARLRALSSNAA